MASFYEFLNVSILNVTNLKNSGNVKVNIIRDEKLVGTQTAKTFKSPLPPIKLEKNTAITFEVVSSESNQIEGEVTLSHSHLNNIEHNLLLFVSLPVADVDNSQKVASLSPEDWFDNNIKSDIRIALLIQRIKIKKTKYNHYSKKIFVSFAQTSFNEELYNIEPVPIESRKLLYSINSEPPDSESSDSLNLVDCSKSISVSGDSSYSESEEESKESDPSTTSIASVSDIFADVGIINPKENVPTKEMPTFSIEKVDKQSPLYLELVKKRLNRYEKGIVYLQENDVNSGGIDILQKEADKIMKHIYHIEKGQIDSLNDIPSEMTPEMLFGKPLSQIKHEKQSLLDSMNI